MKERVLKQYAGGSITAKVFGSPWSNTQPGGTSRYEQLLFSQNSLTGPPYREIHNFSKWGYTFDPGRLNGTLNYQDYTYNNFPFGRYRYPKWTPTTNNEIALMETKALAAVNPKVPIVDVPLFLFELRDLPEALRTFGYWKLKKNKDGKVIPPNFNVGSQYLAYKFGIATVVSDVISLLNLTEEIHKRMVRLTKASEKGKIRGKLRSYTDTVNHGSFSEVLGRDYIWYDVLERRKVDWWFTAATTLELEYALDIAPKDRFYRALGVDRFSLLTAWNALPWSWLADYWTNVGNYLAANRGGFTSYVSNMCLMKETKSDYEFNITQHQASSASWGKASTVTPPRATKHQKERFAIGSPTPKIAWDPILTDGNRSILSALAIAYLGGSSVRFN
jgi:hypothetical protein